MSCNDNPNLTGPDRALRPHRHGRSNADTEGADDESTADVLAAAEIAAAPENEDATTTKDPCCSKTRNGRNRSNELGNIGYVIAGCAWRRGRARNHRDLRGSYTRPAGN